MKKSNIYHEDFRIHSSVVEASVQILICALGNLQHIRFLVHLLMRV